MKSLDKITTIKQHTPQINQLLKTAVTFNLTGRDLTAEHKIVAALSAKNACDAMIQYAKAVADVGLAAGEGVLEGATTIVHLGQNLGDAVNAIIQFPEETLAHVQKSFNNTVFAVSALCNELRKDFELAYEGDEKSMHEWAARRTARGQKVDAFFELLEKKYYETSFRDKVKLVARLFTEYELLGVLGGALFEEAAAVADMVTCEAEMATSSLVDIFVNPHNALAQQVGQVAVQTVEYEPAILSEVFNCIQVDGVWLARLHEAESAVPSTIIQQFFAERAAACEVIEKYSSLGIKTRGESIGKLLNVSKDLISLPRLEYMIDRYHKIPGFTGKADAVLERILKVGKLKNDGSGRLVPWDLNSAKGTLFEVEAAVRLETEHGMKITEFGAKYHKDGTVAKKSTDPLDFDLATHDTLIECKNGNLDRMATKPKALKDFIDILLEHKETAEKVAHKKYIFVSSKPLHELLKQELERNNINFIEFL